MKFLLKLRDVTLSILPVVVICLFIHFAFHRFSDGVIFSFLISTVLIIVGETLFFLGVDNSIIPMGEIVGNSSNKSSKIFVLILFGFIFGLFATLAEPDVSVLAGQAIGMGVGVSRIVFMFIIGAGVGVAVAFALIRIVARIPFKIVLIVILAIILIFCFFVPHSLIALAFDAGGATTGIVTSPFLIAIASGISLNRSKNSTDNSFGVIGIASLGPVLALMFYFALAHISGDVSSVSGQTSADFFSLMLEELQATSLSVLPLVFFFFIYELIFVKLPKKKVGEILIGALFTFVGLFLFLLGLDYGFISMGRELGAFLSGTPNYVIILFCVVLGFIITFTEPAVRILGKQIEDVTSGHIKSKVVIISIAVSMCFALLINAVRIIYNIDFLWIIGIGYGLAVILMIFCEPLFVGIGFDSGGVASGPISAAFILPLMLGLADGAEGFGIIALVGLMPIIVLQILGIIYKLKLVAIRRSEEKHALRIAYGMDMLSQTDKLRKEANKIKKLKQKKVEEDESEEN